MRLINCKKCGSLFRKKLRNICDSCLEVENENIKKITQFVDKYKENFISMSEIYKGTQIELEIIEDLYKNGRLTGIANRITLKCKICGVETKNTDKKGHFCSKCIQHMVNDGDIPKPLEIHKGKVELRKFDKDIMHSAKTISPQERLKYGFKRSFD